MEITIEKLVGVYTDGFITYPNGDEAQSILIVFLCCPASGTIRSDGQETLDLAYMSPVKMPPLFSKQHHDALDDYLHGRFGSYR